MPADIVSLIELSEQESLRYGRTTVNLAVNYGGRQEILQSIRKIGNKIAAGRLKPEDVTIDDIAAGLYTAGQPDPDLVIRPSGEYRLSTLLIWQTPYSEFWTSEILWPDFTPEDFDKALDEYAKRNRRFGGI